MEEKRGENTWKTSTPIASLLSYHIMTQNKELERTQEKAKAVNRLVSPINRTLP